jgi:hypothetical protein
MVWSKDLAKLKQGLKAQSINSSPQKPAKPPPRPIMPKSLEEEDDLFLAAVGKARSASSITQAAFQGEQEFTEAMSQLKGLKPKDPASPVATSAHKEPQGNGQPDPPANSEKTFAATTTPPANAMASKPLDKRENTDSNAPAKKAAEKIQLAAGMVIEVDGVLDLRSHNAEDATERLKERVLDCICLGWHSLHVILGYSEVLQSVFIDFINSPNSHPVAKYAQAPVPMGGAQAWVLYFAPQTNKTESL